MNLVGNKSLMMMCRTDGNRIKYFIKTSLYVTIELNFNLKRRYRPGTKKLNSIVPLDTKLN